MRDIPEWNQPQHFNKSLRDQKNSFTGNLNNESTVRFDRKKTFTHLKKTLLNAAYPIRYVGIGQTAVLPIDSFDHMLTVLNAHTFERYHVSYSFESLSFPIELVPLNTLQVFYHELEIVKTPMFEADRATIENELGKTFGVDCVSEDASIVTYMMYFENGVFANTMEEALSRIVRRFAPKVERFMHQRPFIDYQMRTVIDSAF